MISRKLRFIALAGVIAVLALGMPAASNAIVLGPNQPFITFPTLPGGYSTNLMNVTGTADPGTFIRINGGITPCCGAQSPLMAGPSLVPPSGLWSLAISVPDGHYRIYATANNGLADSPPQIREFTTDTINPVAPLVNPIVTTPGSKAADITGFAEPLAFVVATDEAGLIRKATAAQDGTFLIKGLWTPAAHLVAVIQYDLAFNPSPPSAPQAFLISYDASAPSPPIIISPVQNGLAAADVIITGTAEPLSKVSLFESTTGGFIFYFNDINGTAGPSIQVDGTGAWSAELFMLDSTHFLQARAKDALGNTSIDSPVRSFNVDGKAPRTSVNRAQLYTLFGIYLNGDGLTGLASDNFGLAQVRVRILDGSSVIVDEIAVCPCFGTTNVRWTDMPPDMALGLYTVEVTATDLVGNVSDAATEDILVLI